MTSIYTTPRSEIGTPIFDLLKEVGGTCPTGDAPRLAFTKLLPPDVAAHVTLHMDFPQCQRFEELRTFTDKYVKVMTALDRQRKGVRSQAPVRLIDNLNSDGEFDGLAIDDAESDDNSDFVYPAIGGLDVEQRVCSVSLYECERLHSSRAWRRRPVSTTAWRTWTIPA